MYSETIKKEKQKKKFLERSKNNIDCEVSKASREIMLDRFSNGSEIDFPFT